MHVVLQSGDRSVGVRDVRSAEDTPEAGGQETWHVSPRAFCHSRSLGHVVCRNGHMSPETADGSGCPCVSVDLVIKEKLYLLKGI